MNVVDSSGWLEYFTLGSNTEFFAAPIEAVDELLSRFASWEGEAPAEPRSLRDYGSAGASPSLQTVLL